MTDNLSKGQKGKSLLKHITKFSKKAKHLTKKDNTNLSCSDFSSSESEQETSDQVAPGTPKLQQLKQTEEITMAEGGSVDFNKVFENVASKCFNKFLEVREEDQHHLHR